MPSDTQNLVKDILAYVEVKTARLKLALVSKIAALFSNLLSLCLFIIFVFFLVFFTSFGIAEWLNVKLDSPYYGFLVVGGFYLLSVIMVLILYRRSVIQTFFESFMMKLIDKDENEED